MVQCTMCSQVSKLELTFLLLFIHSIIDDIVYQSNLYAINSPKRLTLWTRLTKSLVNSICN